MSYDKAATHHIIGTFDFGAAANDTFGIKGPKGKSGILVNYGVEGVSEVFNGSTVTPKVAVGTASDPDAYGEELDLDGVAAGSTDVVSVTNGRPDQRGIYVLAEPIDLIPQQNFRCEVNLPTAQTLSATVALSVYLDGFFKREVH